MSLVVKEREPIRVALLIWIVSSFLTVFLFGFIIIITESFYDKRIILSLIDKINNQVGAGTIKIASSSNGTKKISRNDFKSPSYTTNWTDLRLVD